jgi:hypothetical protein
MKTSILDIINEETKKVGFKEHGLTYKEKNILDDILSNDSLNEEIDFNKVLSKVKGYAVNGLLTAGIVSALMSNDAFSQTQKKNIYDFAKEIKLPDLKSDETKKSETPNYKATNDPDVFIGKYGAKITKSAFDKAQNDPKNKMKFTDFDAYADWVGSWARPVHDISDKDLEKPKYYRTYSAGYNIPETDITYLLSKGDETKKVVNDILKRVIKKDNQIPMFGNQDADQLMSLIKYYKLLDKTMSQKK